MKNEHSLTFIRNILIPSIIILSCFNIRKLLIVSNIFSNIFTPIQSGYALFSLPCIYFWKINFNTNIMVGYAKRRVFSDT